MNRLTHTRTRTRTGEMGGDSDSDEGCSGLGAAAGVDELGAASRRRFRNGYGW